MSGCDIGEEPGACVSCGLGLTDVEKPEGICMDCRKPFCNQCQGSGENLDDTCSACGGSGKELHAKCGDCESIVPVTKEELERIEEDSPHICKSCGDGYIDEQIQFAHDDADWPYLP